MEKILVFTDWYLPGYRGGGPIQSVAALVSFLSRDFEFYIVTRDRDLGVNHSYAEIKKNNWNKLENCHVYYCSPSLYFQLKMLIAIKKIDSKIFYLNSVFSFSYTIIPLFAKKIGFLKKSKCLVAPRGELSVGALNIKPLKKILFINFAKILGLYKSIQWHASTNFERDEIINQFCCKSINISVARNLSLNYKLDKLNLFNYKKEAGVVKLVTLSRISPKKNLTYTLKILSKIKGKVFFDIYGPCEDVNYWNNQCIPLINALNKNVTVRYKKEIHHENVHKVLSDYDFFVFPTLGENYGHVIREALEAGLPLLISQNTPWRGLEQKGIGWDLNLNTTEEFVKRINYCIKMDSFEYEKMRIKVLSYADYINNKSIDVTVNKDMFYKLLFFK